MLSFSGHAWACITDRPGSAITYTNNWPPDETVGNVPSPGIILMDRGQHYHAS